MLAIPLQNALLFTVECIFNFYIGIILVRLLLQIVRADFYNPIAEFVVKLSNPLLKPLRKIIPGMFGFDWASVVLALMLQVLELILTFIIKGFSLTIQPNSIIGLFIWSLAELIDKFLLILMVAIFIRAIMSWVHSGYNPASAVIMQITEPMCRPIRRLVPDLGAIDISPIILIFLLVLLSKTIPVLLIGLSNTLL